MRLARAGRWAWLTAFFIAAAQAQPAAERLAPCAACHGAAGVSAVPGTPSLAAQPALFVENQLVLIREGVREVNPAMAAALKGIRDAEIRALAKHYAALAPPRPAEPPDAQTAKRAKTIVRKAHCASCHLPDFAGREQIPRLAGQREEYLLEAMRAYRDNRRSGGDTLMAAALYGIADADLQLLARYLARLP
ncbi:MAG TPA: c-type cytochrome [Burkholderiales bacterium]|nr:c-type cytochrome [Burkholderiales bacterium]